LANTSPSDDDPSDVEEHTFWCDKQEEFRVRDKLNWHISKNQIVGSTVSTSLSFYRLVPTSSPNFVFSTPLRVCDLDDAPNYLWKDPAAVRTLCTLRSDLTGIPVSKYQVTRNSNGQSYYRVDYQLVMKVQDEVSDAGDMTAENANRNRC
jgi:hypothetical protein